jgi:hypothetical protein
MSKRPIIVIKIYDLVCYLNNTETMETEGKKGKVVPVLN